MKKFLYIGAMAAFLLTACSSQQKQKKKQSMLKQKKILRKVFYMSQKIRLQIS